MSYVMGAALAAPASWPSVVLHRIETAGMVAAVQERDSDRTDRAAIDAVLAGDPSAFDHLVRKYMRKALSIAWGVVRESAEAEDVTQEALVKAYQRLGTMKSNEAFGPWLYRIVTNLALDRLRARKRVRVEELGDFHVARERTDAVTTEALASRIDKAIESLPEMQRLAARLYLVEELSHAEIATILNSNEGSVRSNLSHARRKLQEQLRDLYEDLR